jgi:hypothetical protein
VEQLKLRSMTSAIQDLAVHATLFALVIKFVPAIQ